MAQSFIPLNNHFKSLDICRKFRQAFSPEQFYLSTQTDVMTFSSFEKSPEDIFNFDSKMVDKFTLKDKSISLSTIDPKNTLEANNSKLQFSDSNMQNIIFNRLYEVHVLEEPKHSCNISYENENGVAIKTNDCNCTHCNEVDHNCKCINKPKNLMKNGKIAVDPEVLLFAENQAYDLLMSSENDIQIKSFNKGDHEMESLKLDQHAKFPHLTGRDLLMFAKQIATGMVSDSTYMLNFTQSNRIVCGKPSANTDQSDGFIFIGFSSKQ